MGVLFLVQPSQRCLQIFFAKYSLTYDFFIQAGEVVKKYFLKPPKCILSLFLANNIVLCSLKQIGSLKNDNS
jgi:hypothetical protein